MTKSTNIKSPSSLANVRPENQPLPASLHGSAPHTSGLPTSQSLGMQTLESTEIARTASEIPVGASLPGKIFRDMKTTVIEAIQSGRAATQVACDAWNAFWYSPSDPVVLGMMRIFVGAMLVYTHLVWGLNLPAFFGSQGWNSPETLSLIQKDMFAPSFWWYVPDAWLTQVHCVCMGILVLFWLGFATRVTSILAMIITVSYSYRAQLANFGLDQINAILCFYLCVGPSGATLSIDRWLAVRKARKLALRAGAAPALPAVPRSLSANIAVRLTQLHFCVIYVYAGLSKLQGDAWWNGEATWRAFANLEYQSVDMTWIAWYPWLSDLITHATIIWEVFFIALIWVHPIRPLVLALGFLMHAGIGGLMGMWTFGLIMIFGHISFWPTESVRWLLSWMPGIATLVGETASNPGMAMSLATSETGLPGLEAGMAITTPEGLSIQKSDSSKKALPRKGSLRRGLLCIDSTVKRRLRCERYFLRQGYRCLATDDLQEGLAIRDATAPDAVILMGTNLSDEEVAGFHQSHNSRPDAQPLFMVLPEEQSKRLNGRIHTPGSHILNSPIRLGNLHREIRITLTDAKQATAEASAAVTEP